MDKKLLIFLLSFFVVLGLWQKFVVDPMIKKPAVQTAAKTTALPAPAPQTAPSQATPLPTQTVELAPPQVPGIVEGLVPSKSVDVDTALYHAQFSSEGGVLTSFRLKKYTDDFGDPLEIVSDVAEMNQRPLGMSFDDKNLTPVAAKAQFSMDKESLSLSGHETGDLTMVYRNGPYTFQKFFRFQADSYVIESVFEARQGDTFLPVRVNWAPGVESLKDYKDPAQATPSRALVNSGDKVDFLDSKQGEQFKKIGSTVRWAGAETSYFCSIFIPKTPSDAFLVQVKPGENKLPHNVNVLLGPQRPGPLPMSIYIGPKDYQLLKGMGLHLEKAVDYGFFAPVVVPLYFTLTYLHGLTGNYGWAIVFLTLFVKILFIPLVQKSFSSMKKMQVMQPELKKIQDKYAGMKNDDPRKANMNTEIMQMHKRYGVNPLSGCLPMLLQFPVLYAFYRLLAHTIELRKAPFIFWLQDLSRPDPMYITPLLMGGTMLIQQRMTPTTDPMQKNMMIVMPLMFTFMSFKFASGLVVYWLLSNILAILHQLYFQSQQKKAEIKVAA